VTGKKPKTAQVPSLNYNFKGEKLVVAFFISPLCSRAGVAQRAVDLYDNVVVERQAQARALSGGFRGKKRVKVFSRMSRGMPLPLSRIRASLSINGAGKAGDVENRFDRRAGCG
jgi:hypothetical protein